MIYETQRWIALQKYSKKSPISKIWLILFAILKSDVGYPTWCTEHDLNITLDGRYNSAFLPLCNFAQLQ